MAQHCSYCGKTEKQHKGSCIDLSLIKKIPPGPEECHFQEYSNDENLGKNPLVHIPRKFYQAIGPDKTIYDMIKDELQDAYEALEEISEKSNPTIVRRPVTDVGPDKG